MNKPSISIYPILGLLLLIIIGGMAYYGAIPQYSGYHQFAEDQFGCTDHNVYSNLPFLLVGIYGLFLFLLSKNLKLLYLSALSIFLSLGSAYYHQSPNTDTLFFDRLPMVLIFMLFFSEIFHKISHFKTSKLIVLLGSLLGILSLFYWKYSLSLNQEDLRMYLLIQFFPMLSVPVILFFHRILIVNRSFMGVLLFYILAKIFELSDESFYQLSGIGGHAIKHYFSALALCSMFLFFKKDSLKRYEKSSEN